MNDIHKLLKHLYAPEVYHSVNTHTALTIGSYVEEAGFHFYALDGHQATNKADFLSLSKTIFGFPQSTGSSWDSFLDRLRDIPWVPTPSVPKYSKGAIVLFDHFEDLARTDPESFITLYGCFWEAFTFKWEREQYPAYLVLRGDTTALPDSVVVDTLSID